VLSPDQRPTFHVEDLGQDQSKGGDGQNNVGHLIPDASCDQHIAVVTKCNIDLGTTFDLVDKSSKESTPMANVQTTNVAISQEELD